MTTPRARPTSGFDAGLDRARQALAILTEFGTARRPALFRGRRFVIAHLDGVSRDLLRRALSTGRMPFLARALEREEFAWSDAWSGCPASTVAFQSALLYGERGDIPGFAWWDRQRRQEVRMDDAGEAFRVEERVGRSFPGLLEGGSVYFSILSGGAEDPAFCTTRLARHLTLPMMEGANGWDHLASLLAHLLVLMRAGESIGRTARSSLGNGLSWSMACGRLKHEPRFLLERMLAGRIFNELATHLTLLDMARGVPAIYACWTGYDDVAHRRGPQAEEAMEELTAADASLATIAGAVRARPDLRYEMYVLSDHGQEPTRPAERVLGGPTYLDWLLAAGPDGRVDPDGVRQVARVRRRDEVLSALPLFTRAACAGRRLRGGGDEGRAPLQVVDGGDIAHVYLEDEAAPLDRQALEARHPALLAAARSCPALGILAVRGGSSGFAWHRGRWHDLADPRALEGVARYGSARLRQMLAEQLAIPSSGDMVAFGSAAPGGDVAFGWEFGSHGGVGADDVETFILHPSSVTLPATASSGPLGLHDFFRDRFFPRTHARA